MNDTMFPCSLNKTSLVPFASDVRADGKAAVHPTEAQSW